MIREVEEETGLVVRSTGLATIDSDLVPSTDGRVMHSIRILYFAELIGGRLRSEAEGTTDLCEWHELDDLAELPTVDLVDVGIAALPPRTPDHKEPFMPTNDKPKGPASYFPSIEKKYGMPVSHWFALLEKQKQLKHMEMVAWLKSEHGLGHGHANALVAHFRNQSGS